MCSLGQCIGGTGGGSAAVGGGSAGGMATGGASGAPKGDTCNDPLPLPMGEVLGLDAGFRNDYNNSEGCLITGDNDLVFSIDVPAGQQLTASALAIGSPLSYVGVALVASASECGTSCVASRSGIGVRGIPVFVSWTNKGTTAQKIFFIVDPHEALAVRVASRLTTPPADDTCQGATTVMPGANLANQTTEGYASDYAGSLAMPNQGCGRPSRGGDRVYRVSVPSMQSGTFVATAASDAGVPPTLSLIEGPSAATCDAMPRVCLGGTLSNPTGGATSLAYFNSGAAAKDLFVVANQYDPPTPFSVSYTTAAGVADDTCTTAMTEIPLGETQQTLAGFAVNYSGMASGCVANSGPDRVYVAKVPANNTLIVELADRRLDGGVTLLGNVIRGSASTCDSTSRTCQGGVNLPFGGTKHLAMTNTGATEERGFIAIGALTNMAMPREFTMNARLVAAVPGETCQTAVALAPTRGTPATAQGNTRFASKDIVYGPQASCSGSGRTINERIYALTIPQGETAEVAVNPASELIVDIIRGPLSACQTPSMPCEPPRDANDAGVLTLSVPNMAAAAETVWVVVGSDTRSRVDYSVTATLR
jgi:hypothetical protein